MSYWASRRSSVRQKHRNLQCRLSLRLFSFESNLSVELNGLLVLCGEGDRVLHAGAPDPPNLSGSADVGDGIAVDQHEVGPSARFDHASIVQPEVLGRQYGRGAQRLDGRQAGVDEQLELFVQTFAVAGREGYAGSGVSVGTRENRHTGSVQLGD